LGATAGGHPLGAFAKDFGQDDEMDSGSKNFNALREPPGRSRFEQWAPSCENKKTRRRKHKKKKKNRSALAESDERRLPPSPSFPLSPRGSHPTLGFLIL